jgi:hypothetical protein
MNHWHSSLCRLDLLAALAFCALLTACVGATRLPARTRGPAGVQIQKNELDMSFLETPSVHRDDVTSKLASIDTGYHGPHLFWGRWVDSKWGYWWLVFAAGPGTGGGTGAGDAKRIWHVKNLLVTFDDNGVMQEREVIDNDRILWRELHTHVAQMPALDLSQPRYFALGSGSRAILLHQDYFEVTGMKKGPARISPSSIIRVDHVPSKDKRQNAGITCHTLHFSEKTPVGRNLKFCGNAEMVVTLFEFLQQTAPKTMQWE